MTGININLSGIAASLGTPLEGFHAIFDNYTNVVDIITEFITNPIFTVFCILLLILTLIDR